MPQNLTPQQRSIVQRLLDGDRLVRDGHGYAWATPNAAWEKASIAAKTLVYNRQVLPIGSRYFFTTEAYRAVTGQKPTGDHATWCAEADARLDYLRSMTAPDN